jgi:hypothetical protein
MLKIWPGPLLLAVALACPSQNSFADTYRCGRKLIHSGDSSADLLRVCGEPRHKDRGHETIRLEGSRQRVPVERWYYKKSGLSLERIVLVHRGRVISIEVGER